MVFFFFSPFQKHAPIGKSILSVTRVTDTAAGCEGHRNAIVDVIFSRIKEHGVLLNIIIIITVVCRVTEKLLSHTRIAIAIRNVFIRVSPAHRIPVEYRLRRRSPSVGDAKVFVNFFFFQLGLT